jgi:hypothetical protein
MTIFAEWSRPPIGELGALRGGSSLGCLRDASKQMSWNAASLLVEEHNFSSWTMVTGQLDGDHFGEQP